MTITTETRQGDRMRQVNDSMLESLVNSGYDEPIAFFCECSDPDCYQAVWLTSAEYAEARAEPTWRPLLEAHSAADGADGSW